MTETFNIFIEALRQLVWQLAALLPKVIIAILIWVIGKKLLQIGINLIQKVNITKTTIDDKVINFLVKVALPLGKFILILIVLDYLGIGRTIISAFASGLTWMIAIALGLAFGKALEEDADQLVGEIRKHFKK